MKKGTAAVLSAIAGGIAGGIGGAVHAYRHEHKKLEMEQTITRKDNAILKAYSHWLQREQKGEFFAEYFEKMGFKKIAIYGMHYLGESLLSELKGSGIEVVYAIDKNIERHDTDLLMYKPDDELPDVDAVVVTAFFFFHEIEEALMGKVNCPIVSIEDIIYE